MEPARRERRAVWVHSKLMIVDDAFLTIGSANFDNRSMGFDTEVNASWWAEPGSSLSEAVRDLRGRLLAEHTGAADAAAVAGIGVIDALERATASGRIHAYAPPLMGRLVER